MYLLLAHIFSVCNISYKFFLIILVYILLQELTSKQKTCSHFHVNRAINEIIDLLQ